MRLKSICLILFFVFTTFSVFSDYSGPAILKRGPVFHEGIEFLGLNAIPSQYGEYYIGNEKITVYFTEEEIFLSDEWKAADCGIPGHFQKKHAEEDDLYVAAYSDPRGWTVFFSYGTEFESFCSFLTSYIKRQNYFINIVRDKSVFSFPAVLEFR